MNESAPDPLVDLVQILRPALELALDVARSESRESSKATVPPALWPFLTLARNPAPALRAALDSLEVEEFRLKVAAHASEDALGTTCLSFLNRSAGWEQDLGAAVQKVIAQGLERAAGQAQREAERSSRKSQMLAQRLEETERRYSAVLARLTEVERNLQDVVQLLDERTTERDLLFDQRARAVRELKQAEARLAAQTEQLRALDPAVTAAQGTGLDAAAAADPVGALDSTVQMDPAMAHDAARWRLIGPELEQLVGDAVGVMERLQALQSQLGEDRADPSRTSSTTSPQRRRVRTAPTVDAGLLSNSAAYLESLLRSPGLYVFVDGYNLSMLLWPQLDAYSQRRALVSAANSIAARTGARLWLVFDGVGEGSRGRPADGMCRSGVELVFSSELIEADDEILNRVEQLKPTQAVVVVSNDRRVQAGAHALGAEVVSSTVLRSFILSNG